MKTNSRKMISLFLISAIMMSLLGFFSMNSVAAYDPQSDYKVQGKLYDGSYVVSAFNVKDYGAVGDGIADDTKAIEDAIQAIRFGPQASVLYFPEGSYRITKPGFQISTGMTILGQSNTEIGNFGVGKGSVVICDFDASEDESVFMLAAGSTLVGMSFYYPMQNLENPIAYPATIGTMSGGDYVTVRDIVLYNSYYGIDTTGGGQHVANIAGTVLHCGVNICANAEVSEFMNIDFNASYWHSYDGTDQTSIRAYTKKHATGLMIGYVDEMLVYHVSCPEDDFDIGIYFYVEQRMRDMGNSGVAYGNFYRIEHTKVSFEDGYDYPDGWPRAQFLDDVPATEAYQFDEPSARYSTKDTLFNVRTFGAKGNGTTDDTIAFRNALEAARQNGGGIVFVPAGKYLISGKLELPQNTELLGESVGYRDYSSSEIYVNYNGSGEEDYFIGLSQGSGVQGLQFYLPSHSPQSYQLPEGKNYGYKNRKTYDVYQDQFPIEYLTIPSYPYLIRGKGESIWIENVGIVNGWNGVDLATECCNNFTIRSLWGTCMNQGLNIGGGSSVGQISCVWFTYGSWWKAINRSIDLSWYSYYNAKAISFGDCSDIAILSAGCFGLSRGFEFVAEKTGEPENISILRAVVDMPFGERCVDLTAGDQISILGVSTGINTLPAIKKTAIAVQTGDDMHGKVRIYGQNIWGNTSNDIKNNTRLYTEDSTDADVIEHSFSFGDYLIVFTDSNEPEYDQPEHPEGIVENTSVYFDYKSGSEYSFDETSCVITAKPGNGLASFLNSTNTETGALENDYSHNYIRYSYRFLEQYEEVDGNSDWLMYFSFRNPSGYLPMWAVDYAAYVIISRESLQIAVYYDAQIVVSEWLTFDSIVENRGGRFELIDTAWHTIEILINDEEGSITVIKDRGTSLEDSVTAYIDVNGNTTLLGSGGYSFCFYHADMEICDLSFSSTIPIMEEERVPIETDLVTDIAESENNSNTIQCDETEFEELLPNEQGKSNALLLACALPVVVVAVVVMCFALKKGKTRTK